MASSNAHRYPLAQQLLRASAKGDLHRTVALIQNGATIAVNKHGRTALHIAAHRGFLDIVRVLLQSGCDPDLQDDNGDTAVQRAVNAGHTHIVHRLLDEACSVDRQNNLGDTAIHEAARCGHNHILKHLIKANANVDCANKNGDCPLHMSCGNGHATSTKHLVSACSEVSPFNKQKDTPLHVAARFGHVSCAKILIISNCNINAKNHLGNTPMHVAVLAQNKQIVRLLLDAGIDSNKYKNKKGKTALNLAKDMDSGELALMLISGPRPASSRQRGRNINRDSTKPQRSKSEPRENTADKNVAANDHKQKVSFKRFLPSRKKKRPASHSPERRRSQKKVLPPVKHQDKHNDLLDNYNKKLAVNPYVVPQLYSLYRDDGGKVRQRPVLEQLPNPTPQIVEQMHMKIERTRDELRDSVEQTNSALMRKIQDLQHQTEFKLKSLDQLTSERIQAERITCLHRIDQRAMHERTLIEHNVLTKLQGWMENRVEQRLPESSINRSYSVDVKPNDFALTHTRTSSDEGSLHNEDLQPSVHARRLMMRRNREAESRSLDSGVGGMPSTKEQSPYPSPAAGATRILSSSPHPGAENTHRSHRIGLLQRQKRVLSYTPPPASQSDSSRSMTPVKFQNCPEMYYVGLQHGSQIARSSPDMRQCASAQSWHGAINSPSPVLDCHPSYCTDEETYLLNMLRQENSHLAQKFYQRSKEKLYQMPESVGYEFQHEDIAIIDQLRDFTLSQTHAV